MKIGRLFLIGLAALAVPAIGISSWLAVGATVKWIHAREVTQQSRAMSDLMRLLTDIAIESGQLQEAAFADTPNLDALAKWKGVTDDALQRSSKSAGDADTRAVVDMANGAVTKLRAMTAAAIAKPKSERDPDFAKELLATRTEVGNRIRKQLSIIETGIVQTDPAIGMMVQLGSQMMAMRDAAGARSVLITPWLAGKPYGSDDVIRALQMSGRIAGIWDRALVTLGQIQPGPRLAAARDQARSNFFDSAEPRYLALIKAAFDHTEWSMAYADFRKFTVAALTEIVPVREAAMNEAVERAEREREGAAAQLAIALAATLAEIGIAAGALIILMRRLVRPVEEMTRTVARIADGEFELTVDYRDRTDEIGAMANAVEVLRDHSAERVMLAEAAEAQTRAKLEGAARRDAVTREFERRAGSLVASLGEAASALRGTAEGMHSTANETQSLTGRVAGAADLAAHGVAAVASAVEELSASSHEIGSRVERSAAATRQAAEAARRTDAVVQALNRTTGRIGEVVGLIADIASQTNLLALNANIEAARAGQAGAGFGVVASEVKNLANRTGKATEEISGQISEIQAATRDAAEAITAIVSMIEEVDGISASIAGAVEEQGAATDEISRNAQTTANGTRELRQIVESVASGATTTGAAAARVLDAADSLRNQAEDMDREVRDFLEQVRAS
jgi:methyl-accepting chemotaxis protein